MVQGFGNDPEHVGHFLGDLAGRHACLVSGFHGLVREVADQDGMSPAVSGRCSPFS